MSVNVFAKIQRSPKDINKMIFSLELEREYEGQETDVGVSARGPDPP